MAMEIERRFLVSDRNILTGASREVIVQGYFFIKNGYAARVRRLHHVQSDGTTRESRATLTLKGPRVGTTRTEYEIDIDPRFAEGILKEIEHKILKSRYQVIDGGETWDIDIFHGDNDGLIIAECEMEYPRRLQLPKWCSEEITDRREFDNENLAVRPYGQWDLST
jgi:CYTH domain-containing protein